MRRRVRCLVAVAVVASVLRPGSAGAHALLLGTSLDQAPVESHTATTVTLRFNSALEPGLSRVVLVDAQGKQRPLEIRPSAERAHVEVVLPPLAPGTYGLRYKVLAADGHVTESVVRFAVPAE